MLGVYSHSGRPTSLRVLEYVRGVLGWHSYTRAL